MSHTFSKAALRGASIIALSLTATAAHATDGYFLNGVGAKAKGSAGVAIAQPQDALSIASNPAAATELDARVDVGVEIFIPNRGAVIQGNGAGLNGDHKGNGSNPFVLPEFGYVRPLSDDISVGLAVYGNGGMNTNYKANPFTSFGATGNAGVDLKQIFITPTIAAKIAPGHSIGVSAIGLVQSFRMEGIQPFAAASADPANFTNRGTDWSLGGGFRVGYLGKLSDSFSVGAFYQSKVWAGKFDKYAGLFAQQGGFDVPASYGAGIAFKATPQLTLAADVKQIEYSKVQSVGNPLSNLFTPLPFGADNGPGFGWRDVTAYKGAVTYQASETLTVRAGYSYNDNPVPASETFLNILAPGVVQHHVSAGATFKLGTGDEITGFVMHAPKNTVKGSGSIPAPYGGGEANVRLSETSFGVSYGHTF